MANHESFTWEFTATFNVKKIGIPALNLPKWFIIVVHKRHLERVHDLGYIHRVFSNTPVDVKCILFIYPVVYNPCIKPTNMH